MNIRTECQAHGCWVAVDDDTYDGPGCPIGSGNTRQEAIDDLMEQFETRADQPAGDQQ